MGKPAERVVAVRWKKNVGTTRRVMKSGTYRVEHGASSRGEGTADHGKQDVLRAGRGRVGWVDEEKGTDDDLAENKISAETRCGP